MQRPLYCQLFEHLNYEVVQSHAKQLLCALALQHVLPTWSNCSIGSHTICNVKHTHWPQTVPLQCVGLVPCVDQGSTLSSTQTHTRHAQTQSLYYTLCFPCKLHLTISTTGWISSNKNKIKHTLLIRIEEQNVKRDLQAFHQSLRPLPPSLLNILIGCLKHHPASLQQTKD